MALAIKFKEMIGTGEVRDYSDLAQLGYVSRARITQIMNLVNLAPDIQEQILTGSMDGLNERAIRKLSALVDWTEQRYEWHELEP